MDIRTEDFWRELLEYYAAHGRHDMAWRQAEPDGGYNPYKILVSELMLQQTQVVRVTPKFHEFVGQFPDVQALAAAGLADVLRLWSGLGYNRRAKFLWQAAANVVHEQSGEFPRTLASLQTLPGIGPNTAGAIMAYAFDQPVVYVETNIRTVIIHHFFGDAMDISDKEIKEILEQLVAHTADADKLSPREFYWAMMDYGAFLKKFVGNLNRSSRSYKKQSAFNGSKRQLRGAVIRLLGEKSYHRAELLTALNDSRAVVVLSELKAEGLVTQSGEIFSLA